MIVDLAQLSLAERLQLVEYLWDTIAATPDSLPVTDVQKAELDRRLASYRASPTDGRGWAEIKAALLKQPQP
jgi:putative addiction module component (TIGR02574 family)